MFYVSTDLHCSMLPKCDGLELLSIVSNGFCQVCISLFHRSPSSSPLILDSYIESLNVHQYSNCILLCDFNVNFISHSCCNNSLLSKLRSLSYLFSVQQIVSDVHHNGFVSLIDLIFVSNNKFCEESQGMQCQRTSRHNCANTSKGCVVWCYNQADWERALSFGFGF